MLELTEIRIYPFDTRGAGGKVRAYAEVVIDGSLAIRGIKVIETDAGGLFISFPSHMGRDGKFRELVAPTDSTTRERFRDAIIDAYRQFEDG